jgi:outer membrane protein assembly factor BamA
MAQMPDAAAVEARQQAIRAEFGSLDGQLLMGLTVQCDIEDCRDAARRPTLIKVTGLRVGLPLNPDDLAEAWVRLMKTGLFNQVDIVPKRRPFGVTLTFKAKTAVIITELDIEYADTSSWFYPQQFRSEIRKRVLFHKGGAFPPKPQSGAWTGADAERIASQKRKIVKLYRQQGFRGTQVQIKPTYHGPGDKQVKVVIEVTEGTQPAIGELLVKGNRAFDYPRIVSYFNTGERVDFWRDLFGAFGLGRYSRKALREEVKLLETAYREAGYVAARVRQEGVACDSAKQVIAVEGQTSCKTTVYPLIRIREDDRVVVKFEGNTQISNDGLKSELTFKESGAYDTSAIKASIEAIEAAYQALAYYYVQVEADSERIDPYTTRIRFKIDEGRRVYVRSVIIDGVRHLPMEDVLGAMQTQGIAPDGVIATFGASAGVMQDAQVVNDLLAIRDLYYERGFSRVQFRCARPETEAKAWNSEQLQRAELRARSTAAERTTEGPQIDQAMFRGRMDMWTADPVPTRCFVVEPDEDPRLVTLRFELDEGERTTVDRIDIGALLAGMDVETRDEIFDLLINLQLMTEQRRWIRRAGLNIKKIQSIRSILLRYFHREGYLSAQVTPVCFGETGGPMLEADCTAERLYGAHLDALRFEIETGPRTEVNGILLRGNLTTQKHIIERELLLEDGGAVGTEALFRSQANLRSLGLFDAVSVSTIGRVEGGIEYAHNNPSTVKVVIEEGRYFQVDGLVGLQIASSSTETDEVPVLYTAGASLRDRNVGGLGFELGLGANHANRIDTPQDISGDFASWEGGFFYKDRRLFGTRLDGTATMLFQQGRTVQRDAYQQLYSIEGILGYDFYNLSFPSEWGRGLRFNLSVEVRLERRRLLTTLDERPPFDDLNDSVGLAPSIVWERRDNPLNPTRGWFVSLNTRLVSNTLVSNPTLSYKGNLTASSVHSFFQRRLIIVPSLRVGGIITDLRGDDLPSDFLFFAGGDGVVLPVRGYGDASLDACQGQEDDGFCSGVFADDDEDRERKLAVGGEAMALGSLEVRWPTFLIDDFWFAAFTDIGAIAPEWGVFGEDDIFPSVGGGLRWLVTGQIPLRLDIGVPLRDTGLSVREARYHLNIFYQL